MTAAEWPAYDRDRAKREHRHGAWCHPSAEGCPDLMTPKTPSGEATSGGSRQTLARRAQPPHLTDAGPLCLLAVLWALFVASQLLA